MEKSFTDKMGYKSLFGESSLFNESTKNNSKTMVRNADKAILEMINQEKLAAKVEEEIVIVNGYFYNIDGSFEGKIHSKENDGNESDVYTCSGKDQTLDKNSKTVDYYKDIKLMKANKKNIIHSDFCYIAFVVRGESGNDDIDELKCIAFTSYNRSKKRGGTWRSLLATKYSSVKKKKELSDSNNSNKDKLTRQALFSVMKEENDLTNGAEYWDGTDFLAWGNSETNPDNKLGSNKFVEYKFIEISKEIYDTYLAANGIVVFYGDDGKHKSDTDKGTHTHTKKKVKKKKVGGDGKPILDSKNKPIYEDVEVPNKIKYSIPASVFTNQDYWKSGSFYYETAIKEPFGISATINKGKSIFWKLTKNRLTSSTPPK